MYIRNIIGNGVKKKRYMNKTINELIKIKQ